MKFASQVASYHNKLRRRSRFFSSLMLVSGISLAAVAPFLSYEVSQIECAEKGSVAELGNTDELKTLENELEGKDETITQLEKELDDKTKEIRDLASNPDCDNLVRVIETERERLEADLDVVTTESLEKDENISDLREQLAECEELNEQLTNTEEDCEKFTVVIDALRTQIVTKDRIITKLRATPPKTVKCPALSISGTFQYNDLLTINGNQFMVTYDASDDVGIRYRFKHNGKDVSSRIKSVDKSRIYTFTDRYKNSYRITFGDVVKTGIRYTISSL